MLIVGGHTRVQWISDFVARRVLPLVFDMGKRKDVGFLASRIQLAKYPKSSYNSKVISL